MNPNIYHQMGLAQTSIYPPTNKEEFQRIVIEYLIKNQKLLPMDSFTLKRNIKKIYKNVDLSSFVFEKLNINDIIRELIKNELINQYEEICIQLKRAYFIKSIDIEKLAKTKNDYPLIKDYDIYYNKAKNIATETLKEQNIQISKDSFYINPYKTHNYNNMNDITSPYYFSNKKI